MKKPIIKINAKRLAEMLKQAENQDQAKTIEILNKVEIHTNWSEFYRRVRENA